MKWWKIGVVVLILVLTTISYCYNPCNYSIFPKCPFLLLTGLQCPGCGSQRAIHYLSHLDISKAFHYNALLVATLPVIVILSLAECYRCSRPDLYVKIHNKSYIWCYLIIVVLWWIIRNLINI
mgnify:CR=1 FL=1